MFLLQLESVVDGKVNAGLGGPHPEVVPGGDRATAGAALLTPYCSAQPNTALHYPTDVDRYGFTYRPGSCYNLGLAGAWQPAGGALTRYRPGATISRAGRFLIAVGGTRSAPLSDSGSSDEQRLALSTEQKLTFQFCAATAEEAVTVTVTQ